MLIRCADEMGFKITTFQHVLEGYKVAKEIAAHNAGASTFSDWYGYKMEAADAIPHNASLMTHKGVLVSINSDDAEQARRLNIEAAKAVRYGDVTDDQAFAMVTINAAKQLKIENRVGSVEVGKDADLVVWNAHPMSTKAIVERTYIDGIAYYDRVKDMERVARSPTKRRGSRRRRSGNGAPNGTPNGNGQSNGGANGQRGGGGAGAAQADPPPSTRPNPPAEKYDVKANVGGATWAIINARIMPVSGPVIEKGTIVIKANKIEAVGANVSVPSGAKTFDAAGATVLPGMIDASTDIGERARRPQLRRRLRDPAVRSDAAHGWPSSRQRRDSGGADGGHHDRGGAAGRRHHQRRSARDEPRRMDVEEATVRPSAGSAHDLPGCRRPAGAAGGGGFGGRGGGAPATRRCAEDAEHAPRPRARYAKQPARRVRSTGRSSRSCRSSTASEAMFVAATTEPEHQDAVMWAARQNVRTSSFAPAPTSRGGAAPEAATCPSFSRRFFRCRRAGRISRVSVGRPACWRAVAVLLLERRVRVLAHVPIPGRPIGGVGIVVMTRPSRR